MLLLIGGIGFGFLNLYSALLKNSVQDLPGIVLALIEFVPAALFFRYEANHLLFKSVHEILDENNGKARDLFSNREDFSKFAKRSRNTIHSKKEYYFVVTFLFLLLTSNSTTVLIMQGRIFEVVHNALTIDSINGLYYAVYWGIFVGTIVASIIYSMAGFMVVTLSLNRGKKTFRISKSIVEVKKALALLRSKATAEFEFDFADLSFGELKEALKPFQRLGYDIAIGCALVGLAYAAPGIPLFIITHDLSNWLYYGFIAVIAGLSLAVFIATEIGVRTVWVDLKSEALSVLEQLCDRVKLRCVKSMCKLESYQSREDSAKDVAFVRSAILDLKDTKTSDLTSRTIAQIATTVVLPYIPVVLKILGLY